MIANEVAMRQAIHVHDDDAVESAHVDRAIQDARAAIACLLVGYMLDAMRKSWCPGRKHWSVVLARAVVGDD